MRNTNITLAKVLAMPIVLIVMVLCLLSIPFWPPYLMAKYWQQDGDAVEPIAPIGMAALTAVFGCIPNNYANALAVIYGISTLWPLVMVFGALYNDIFYKIFKPKKELES